MSTATCLFKRRIVGQTFRIAIVICFELASILGTVTVANKKGLIKCSIVDSLKIRSARRQRESTEHWERLKAADARQLGIKRSTTYSLGHFQTLVMQ